MVCGNVQEQKTCVLQHTTSKLKLPLISRFNLLTNLMVANFLEELSVFNWVYSSSVMLLEVLGCTYATLIKPLYLAMMQVCISVMSVCTCVKCHITLALVVNRQLSVCLVTFITGYKWTIIVANFKAWSKYVSQYAQILNCSIHCINNCLSFQPQLLTWCYDCFLGKLICTHI